MEQISEQLLNNFSRLGTKAPRRDGGDNAVAFSTGCPKHARQRVRMKVIDFRHGLKITNIIQSPSTTTAYLLHI
jgi:L-aminopeptidase/D-esterase-like protein